MGNINLQTQSSQRQLGASPIIRRFSRYAVLASAILALGGGCRKTAAPAQKPDARIVAQSALQQSAKCLMALSLLNANSMANEMNEAIKGKKSDKLRQEPQKEMALRELAAMGKEFKAHLLGKGAEAAAESYLSLLPRLRDFGARAVSVSGFNHVIDIAAEAMLYAKEKGDAGEDSRLGSLMLFLHEMPAIKQMAVKEEGGAGQDAVYLKVTLATFISSFSSGDRRFEAIASGAGMWASGSESPLSKQELVTLFEIFASELHVRR